MSLREIAVLLHNKADQIGIIDKETRKHNKQYYTYESDTIKEDDMISDMIYDISQDDSSMLACSSAGGFAYS